MSAARLIPKVEAMIAELKLIRDQLAAEEERADPDPKFLSVADYAKRVSASVSTVRKWVAAGMPCIKQGHIIRIRVAEADVWTPAAEIERSAREAAHRGNG